MQKDFSKKIFSGISLVDKVILIYGFFIILVSAAVVGYRFSGAHIGEGLRDGVLNFSTEDRGEAEVMGVTDQREDAPSQREVGGSLYVTQPEASIQISDHGDGTATLSLVLSEPAQIAGLEFDFLVDGDLRISGISCVDGFDCAYKDIDADSVALGILRELDVVEEYLVGETEFARIEYTKGTEGELLMNYDADSASEVIEIGTTRNLLGTEGVKFGLGQ